MKTDCPKGQFWDAIDGYCYSCPSGYKRTGYSVRDKRACSKAIKEKQAKAAHVKKGVCEKGEFRDALYQRGGDGGTCWSCDTGYDRTLSSVKAKDACSAKTMVWYSRPFDEPGLFSLAGAEEVLLDITKRNPKLIAQSIEQAARTASKSNKKLTPANARKQEIQHFQKEPHKSTAAAAAEVTKQAGSRLLSLAGGAGPQIIISVSFMIATTAIDQVAEIANARPKLQNAVPHAKRDPGLARMVKTNAGNTELLGYWSYLISADEKPSAAFSKQFAKVAKKAATTKAPKAKYR